MERSSHSPRSQDDEFRMSFSIPQKDRLLQPVVLSLGRVKAWRRSEVVLAGGNGLAGCDTIQHILCAMPDSRIAHLDPDCVRRLDDIVCIYQRKSITIDELPVRSSGQDATGNPGPAKSPASDGNRAPESKGTPPELEYRSDTDPQFEGELEAGRYPCFNHVRLHGEYEFGPKFAADINLSCSLAHFSSSNGKLPSIVNAKPHKGAMAGEDAIAIVGVGLGAEVDHHRVFNELLFWSSRLR
jgi:hypothetical protein